MFNDILENFFFLVNKLEIFIKLDIMYKIIGFCDEIFVVKFSLEVFGVILCYIFSGIFYVLRKYLCIKDIWKIRVVDIGMCYV